jgi:hypothetical protein
MTTPNIPAIETIYRGNRFRSRTEAKWAVFFDLVGERYEYEPQGVQLTAGPYLPDFWLPRVSAWFEVKGTWSAALAGCPRFGELAEKSDDPVVVSVGQPARDTEWMLVTNAPAQFEGVDLRVRVDGAGILFPAAPRIGSAGLCAAIGLPRYLRPESQPDGDSLMVGLDGVPGARSRDGKRCAVALDEAGMARFEHGEKGARP